MSLDTLHKGRQPSEYDLSPFRLFLTPDSPRPSDKSTGSVLVRRSDPSRSQIVIYLHIKGTWSTPGEPFLDSTPTEPDICYPDGAPCSTGLIFLRTLRTLDPFVGVGLILVDTDPVP